MLTFTEREARLALFLADLLPGHRVIAASKSHEEASKEGGVQLPEVRVSLDAIDKAGTLEWKLEIAEGNLAPDGIPDAVYTIRRALSSSDCPAAWRPAGGTRRSSAVARIWTQRIQEAGGHHVYTPQMAYANAQEAAILHSGAPAGSTRFGDIAYQGDLPTAGEGAIIRDSLGAQYLGTIESVQPGLVTERATERDFQSGAFIWRTWNHAASDDAGAEYERHDLARTRQLDTSLTGVRRVKVLGARRYIQEIEWPLIAEGRIDEWLALIEQFHHRASLLLILRDGRLLEAAPLEIDCERPGGGSVGRLRLAFDVQTPPNFAVFKEPAS